METANISNITTNQKETVIYEAPGVYITNVRCILGSTTFPIATMLSVGSSIKDETAEMIGAMGGFIGGGLFCWLLAVIFNEWWYVGVVVSGLIAFILMCVITIGTAKTYCVVINTPHGTVSATDNNDEKSISRIIEAVNEAILQNANGFKIT